MDVGAFTPGQVTWLDAVIRVAAACLFALALGIERFVRKKPVDFRPFVIISLASCALTLSTTEFAARADDPQFSIDPAKVMSGIMSGIGFIGAGALFREKHIVHGAGSAAAIWASGAIGIVSGFGFLWLSMLLTGGILAVLLLSRPFTDEYTVRADDDEGSEKERG